MLVSVVPAWGVVSMGSALCSRSWELKQLHLLAVRGSRGVGLLEQLMVTAGRALLAVCNQ